MTDESLDGVRVVLFDYGNTLAHLDHAFIAATLAEHGHQVSPRAVEEADHAAKRWVDRLVADRRAGRDGDRRLPYFAMILESLDVAPERIEPVMRRLDAANASECLWRVVTQGTSDVLARLRARGYRLGVISNADGRVPGDLARHGLARHFNAVLDSHFVGIEKPDPRIFAMALERLGATQAEGVYVGDIHSIDIEGAERAGLTGVLLDPLNLYRGPTCRRIRALGDLLGLLPSVVGSPHGVR